MPEVELRHPLEHLVQFVNGADAGRQKTLFQRLGRAAVILASAT